MEITGQIFIKSNRIEFETVCKLLEEGNHAAAVLLRERETVGDDGVTVKLEGIDISVLCPVLDNFVSEPKTDDVKANYGQECLDVTVETLQVIRDAIGCPVTIRELSNRAGIRYNCMRNLLAWLAQNGVLVRRGKTISEFDLTGALRLCDNPSGSDDTNG